MDDSSVDRKSGEREGSEVQRKGKKKQVREEGEDGIATVSEWAIKSTPSANIIYCCLITSSGQKNVFCFFFHLRVNNEIQCCTRAAANMKPNAGKHSSCWVRRHRFTASLRMLTVQTTQVKANENNHTKIKRIITF